MHALSQRQILKAESQKVRICCYRRNRKKHCLAVKTYFNVLYSFFSEGITIRIAKAHTSHLKVAGLSTGSVTIRQMKNGRQTDTYSYSVANLLCLHRYRDCRQ